MTDYAGDRGGSQKAGLTFLNHNMIDIDRYDRYLIMIIHDIVLKNVGHHETRQSSFLTKQGRIVHRSGKL